MLIAGTLLVPCHTEGVKLAGGWLRVERDRIAEVKVGAAPGTPDLGGPGALICPGFVDAHVHLPQFDSIGHTGVPLMDWLQRFIFPAEAKWADADYAGQMTLRVADQLLRFGTTSVAAYATVHHAGARAAMEALDSKGMRAAVGQVLMDRGAPPELTRPASQLLAEAARLERRGRVEPAVTPRFAISCTDELLRGAGALAARTGALVQTHLAETRDECAQVSRLFGGAGYTEVYKQSGLLTKRSVLAHGIWLEEPDRRLLADAGSTVAHCPTANTFLRSGAMDRAAMRLSNVVVTLGTDVAGGPDRSMVRVARAMVETATRLARVPPTAEECWHQITAGNADALGWPDVGRLAAGSAADLLIVEPDIPWRDRPDPLSAVLYGWDDRWIRRTMVAGRAAYSAAG
jgi:guanine deaminase